MPARSRLEQAAKRATQDPALFQRVWLGRRLWQKQQEIAYSVERNLLTAVKGCHASGKTYVASGLPLYWLTRYAHGKVFTTGPTLRQVKMFWGEISLARNKGLVAGLLPECSTTALKVNDDRYAMGASSSRGVNVQGFHGRDVLVIADEAPGIESDIWDAIEGIRAGGRVRVLKMGNPVVPSGEFYDAFNKGRKVHNCISISAFDCPNLQDPATGLPFTYEQLLTMPEDQLDVTPFPNLITKRWVKERYLTWGPDHPKFRSRVLAEFPSESPYAVFALSWIEKAKRDPTQDEMKRAVDRRSPIQVGIDVAGPGDDETALCARVDGMIIHQEAWHQADPLGPVARILSELAHHPKFPLGSVVVDIVGIGYHFALRLADLGFPVHGFMAGVRAMDTLMFKNQKAEAYFGAREWFKQGLVSGLADEESEAQLATVQYSESGRGQTEIEEKEDMRKRGVSSPDRAEAIVMAFMRVVPTEQRGTTSGPVVISQY